MGAASFQELGVWRKAHQAVLGVYRLTASFPREEIFGLTSQLRRSMVSVPANIAEGFSRRGKADKVRFYNIAEGSLEESRYYLLLARDLGFADTGELLAELDEVGRMLRSYSAAVSAARFSPRSLLSLLFF
ncbi:MAG TPA: four helix bundle protein [Phycisphaerae bacterium]|nr:four helix bundle protein [Phycisphaerae bacterium]